MLTLLRHSVRSGHQSFSNNKSLNDLVGNIVHSSILVPYHGWRVSHRSHHGNHGHVENDESWHPVSKRLYEKMVRSAMCVSRGPGAVVSSCVCSLGWYVRKDRAVPGTTSSHLSQAQVLRNGHTTQGGVCAH